MIDSRIKRVSPISNVRLFELNLGWFLDNRGGKYLSDEIIGVSKAECDAFYDAGNAAYRLIKEAAAYAIRQADWEGLGIPKNVIPLIKYSFSDKRHLLLYGRFDFAGGIERAPLKLLEFNTNISSLLPETVVIQKEQLRHFNPSHSGQFNYLYKDLVRRFFELAGAFPYYEPKLLISTLGRPEEERNADIIGCAAEDAGFKVEYSPLRKIIFSKSDGIFTRKRFGGYERFDFWFKTIPWEYLANETPELMEVLTGIVTKDMAMVINPPYTMVYQSKALLKYLWDLNPHHELLLKTSFSKEDFSYLPFVQKPVLGTKGENIVVFNRYGKALAHTKGSFAHHPLVYQAFTPLLIDSYKEYYQASLSFVKETAALSFRRKNGMIIDKNAEFLSHYIF